MTQQQPPTSQERRNATRRSKHPYHMYDAIQRQPQAMAEMLTKIAQVFVLVIIGKVIVVV